MRKQLFFISLLFSCFIAENTFSQEQTISRPFIQLSDDILSISYEIQNSSRDDLYKVSLEITDESGKKIVARSLKGDIGEEIHGGSTKKILWDLLTDSIRMDAMLYFQVSASLTNPVKPSTVVKAEIAAEESISSNVPEENKSTEPAVNLNRSKMLISSMVFPGFGLSRNNTGSKMHLIKGVAAYSCLGGGIVYMMKYNTTYNDYQAALVPDERTALFTASENQYKTSAAFFLGAAGIWVIDFVWTLSGSKGTKAFASHYSNRIDFQPGYDSYSNSLLLSCKFRF